MVEADTPSCHIVMGPDRRSHDEISIYEAHTHFWFVKMVHEVQDTMTFEVDGSEMAYACGSVYVLLTLF